MSYLLPVLVHTPAYSRMAWPLTYRSESALAPGTLVRVPLGQRELLGVVWDDLTDPPGAVLDPAKLRPIAATLDAITALAPAWRQLITFTANYYQRSLGEVALAALPPQLRDLSSVQLARRLKRQAALPLHEPPARSPDEAKRNPGMKSRYIPDSHPGYKLVQSPCAASGRIREARNDSIQGLSAGVKSPVLARTPGSAGRSKRLLMNLRMDVVS